jgi:hypothetical protein
MVCGGSNRPCLIKTGLTESIPFKICVFRRTSKASRAGLLVYRSVLEPLFPVEGISCTGLARSRPCALLPQPILKLRRFPLWDAAVFYLLVEPHVEGARLGHRRSLVDHQRARFLPKLVVSRTHFFDDFGVRLGDVSFLAGVFLHTRQVRHFIRAKQKLLRMPLGHRLHRFIATGFGGEPVTFAVVSGSTLHRLARRQQNRRRHPHRPLMLEHFFIRAPRVICVLMDINNGLNRLLRMRALQQYTGGQRSGSGGQK